MTCDNHPTRPTLQASDASDGRAPVCPPSGGQTGAAANVKQGGPVTALPFSVRRLPEVSLIPIYTHAANQPKAQPPYSIAGNSCAKRAVVRESINRREIRSPHIKIDQRIFVRVINRKMSNCKNHICKAVKVDIRPKRWLRSYIADILAVKYRRRNRIHIVAYFKIQAIYLSASCSSNGFVV